MKVAIYVRVSTQRQVQAQTIEQQLEQLRLHSQTHGWPWCDDHIFRDDGSSGASLRRPGLDRLRDQISAAAFDRLLITEPSRLARKYVHQVLLIEEFERGGCQVEFLDQPKNDTPHDQLLLQIRGAVAEYERSLIAERMRRGRWQKYRAGGLLPWTRPPYGYRVDPERPRDPAGVRVEPTEAAVVAEMFASYAKEGQSLMGVTRQLVAKARAQSLWAVSLESSECAGDCFQSDVYRNGLSWSDSSYSFAPTPLSSGSCRARPWWSSVYSAGRVDRRGPGASHRESGAI